MPGTTCLRWFEELGNDDVAVVGGKNASLGEMIQHLTAEGIRVPGGFATTADTYREFLRHNELDGTLREFTGALARGGRSLADVGAAIRRAIRHGGFPDEAVRAIRAAYAELCRREGTDDLAVAVRSSATAEDLPEASFTDSEEVTVSCAEGSVIPVIEEFTRPERPERPEQPQPEAR